MAVAPQELKGRGQSSFKKEVRDSGVRSPIDTSSNPTVQKHTTSAPLETRCVQRPMEPIEPPDPGPEPEYGTVTAKEWEIWVAAKETRSEFYLKRNRAEGFAQDNDLRGTF